MRILVALGEKQSEAYVISEVAKIARNTWADVTLLGVTTQPISDLRQGYNPPKNQNLSHRLCFGKDHFALIPRPDDHFQLLFFSSITFRG